MLTGTCIAQMKWESDMKKVRYGFVFWICLMCIYMVLAPVTAHAADVTQDFSVAEYHATATTTSALNVRKGPSKEYEVIELLDAGAEITIIGKTDNGWYQISLESGNGFVSAKYVTAPEEIEETTETEEDLLHSLTRVTSLIGTPTLGMFIAGIAVMVALMVLTLVQVIGLTRELEEPDEYEQDMEEER